MKKIGIVTPWHNTKLLDKKPNVRFDDPHDVMTSGNILNLDIWKKIGGFKDWFFIDGIDIEYGLNLKKHNYKILRVNNLEIDHNLGNIEHKKFLNTNYIIGNHNHIRRYYIARNNHYIFDMYFDVAPHICWDIVGQRKFYKEILLFEKNKIRKIIAMRRGLKDYKKGIKGKYPYRR